MGSHRGVFPIVKNKFPLHAGEEDAMKVRFLATACIAAIAAACEPPVRTVWTGEVAEDAEDANQNENEGEDEDANQNENEDAIADDDATGDAADAGAEEPQLCEHNSDCSDGYACDHVAGACFALPGGMSLADEDEATDAGDEDEDSGGTVEAADADDDADVTPLGEICGDAIDNDGDGDVNEGCPPSESDEDAADDEDENEDAGADDDTADDDAADAGDDDAAGDADTDTADDDSAPAGCASNADCASNESCLATACVADADRDTRPDADDNCPGVANYLQEDANTDGTGDACEPPAEEPDADAGADDDEEEDEDAGTDADDEDAEPAPLTITVTWPSDAPLGDDPWFCGTFLGLGWQCVSVTFGGDDGRTMTVITPFTSDRHYFNACSSECDDPLYGYWLFVKLGDALAERSAAHLTVGTAPVPYTLVANPQNTGANARVNLGAYPSTLP